MAKNYAKRAKRANRPNPREDRNLPDFVQKKTHFRRHSENEETNTSERRVQGKRVDLIPRNIAQEHFVDALEDGSTPVVLAMGPAGCGKTYLATKYAIRELQAGNIDKIVITRPFVSTGGESIGALPGGLIEKLSPIHLPILDVFKEHFPVQTVEKMMLEEVLELAPIAYMRGRTFKRSIVIFDEAQNATPTQMKMVLTRLGEDCKMIVTGDLRQFDRGFEANGLKDFVDRLMATGSSQIAVCSFGNGDIERHPIIEDILRIYGDE